MEEPQPECSGKGRAYSEFQLENIIYALSGTLCSNQSFQAIFSDLTFATKQNNMPFPLLTSFKFGHTTSPLPAFLLLK